MKNREIEQVVAIMKKWKEWNNIIKDCITLKSYCCDHEYDCITLKNYDHEILFKLSMIDW